VHLEDGQLNVSCKQQKQSMRSLPVSGCQLQARTLCSVHVQHVVQQAAKAEEPGHWSFRNQEISMALLQQLGNSAPVSSSSGPVLPCQLLHSVLLCLKVPHLLDLSLQQSQLLTRTKGR
jgi:hypothetical protein